MLSSPLQSVVNFSQVSRTVLTQVAGVAPTGFQNESHCVSLTIVPRGFQNKCPRPCLSHVEDHHGGERMTILNCIASYCFESYCVE